MTTTWHNCGCFEDDELAVKWLCTLHRGIEREQLREQQIREQDELRIEADAWAKWTKAD